MYETKTKPFTTEVREKTIEVPKHKKDASFLGYERKRIKERLSNNPDSHKYLLILSDC